MYNIQHIINFFLSRGQMTPKKLQKLLYYAYAWFLTLENESIEELENKLFEDKFEAWVHGPVIPQVYEQYRNYGYREIAQFDGNLIEFDEDTLDVLNQVWDVYGHYNGNDLESLTHQESPWLNARNGISPLERCRNEITDIDIFECYIRRV